MGHSRQQRGAQTFVLGPGASFAGLDMQALAIQRQSDQPRRGLGQSPPTGITAADAGDAEQYQHASRTTGGR